MSDSNTHKPDQASDSNEQATSSKDTQKTSKQATTNQSKSSSTKPSNGHIGWLWCLLGVIVLIMIIAGYIYTSIGIHQQHQIKKLRHQISTLHHHQHTIAHQPQQNSQSIEAIQQTLNKQHQQLHHLKQKLQRSSHKLQLSHLRHWVRAADFQIRIHHAPNNALAYLQACQQLAQKIQDPQLETFKQTLANKIAQIKELPNINTRPIYHQLVALQVHTQKLAFLPDRFTTHINNSADNWLKQHQPHNDNTSWWQRFYHSVWGSLSQILVIQHHAQRTQPLLPQAAQNIIRLSIDQSFNQAQWALFNKQPMVYRHNLKRIEHLLKQYFKHSPRRKVLLQQLHKLQKQSIVVQLPQLTQLREQLPHTLEETRS